MVLNPVPKPGPPVQRESMIERMERCRSLGHPEAYWCRREVANGAVHVCFWCEECDRAVTHERYPVRGACVSEGWLRKTTGLRLNDLPVIRGQIRYRLCSRCLQTVPCEMHHTAPRAVFTDAETWPVVPLCSRCHHEFTERLETYIRERLTERVRCDTGNAA